MKVLIWITVSVSQAVFLRFNFLPYAAPGADFVHQTALRFIERSPSAYNWFYAAILIGEDSNIRQRGEITAFITLGLYHLIVVSGSHVRAIESLTKRLTKFAPPQFQKIFVLLVLFLFVLANRFEPSCMRAVLAWGLQFLPRRIALKSSLDLQFVVTCLCLTLEPQWLNSLSFQLSCAATLGLTMAGDFAEGLAPFSQRLITSLCCTLTTAPLLFAIQPCLSWMVVPANTLALPLFEAVLMPLSIGGTVAPFLRWCLDPIMTFVFATTEFIADFGKPYFCLSERSLKSWGFIYLGVLYLSWRFALPFLVRRRFWTSQRTLTGNWFSGMWARETLLR